MLREYIWRIRFTLYAMRRAPQFGWKMWWDFSDTNYHEFYLCIGSNPSQCVEEELEAMAASV